MLALLVASCNGCSGCSCSPERVRWQPPPDPDPGPSDRFASSDVLAAEAARLEARQNRAHTLRIHVDRDPVHLNPLASPTVWTRRILQGTVFESLIRYRPPEGGAGNGPGEYEPGLATGWTVSSGGTQILVEIDPDARFHDGSRLTSVDVQFTLDGVRHPKGPSPHFRRLLADVEKIDLAGPRAVRIWLHRPNGYVLRALAEVPIVPKALYDRRLGSTRVEPIGSGPYRVTAREDDLVRLERWDDYRGDAPAVARIDFVHEPDAARALVAAKRGELDIVPALIPAHYPEQVSAPGISSRFEPLDLSPLAFRYLAMDTGEEPLSDPRVRRAIVLLIDRKELSEEVRDGLHRPVAGPVWPGGPGDGAAPAPPPYDPGEAYRLLDAAGWRDIDGDGRRERHGQSLRLSMLALEGDDPEREAIARNLRRAGISVYLRVGTEAVLVNRLESHDFDLALVEWRGIVDDDLSPLLASGGAHNFGRFSDRAVDAALGRLQSAWDPATRAGAAGELAAAVAAAWPVAPITRPHPHGLIHRRVKNAVEWNGWLDLTSIELAPPP